MIYQRRKTTATKVGDVAIGSDFPIRVQSMANTSTMDTEGSVVQAKRIVDAGGELVRFTTQGQREALNMGNIRDALRTAGYSVPLVADVHFNAAVADTAATICEKVRINPGNYVDPARTFKKLEYTDEEYADEIKKIDERFVPFLQICKAHHTAVRIGVNHGSLSDRIMSRYGDTPEGMVESCMEFLRICVREHFTDVVISIKASNTVVMVRTVRLLVAQMAKEEQIAYWSMYKAMGGHGSMVSWRRQGLAANDYVHFAKSGATKVARLLHEWFQWTPDSLPKQSADSTLVDSVVIGDTIIISDTTQTQQTSTIVDTTPIL